MSSEIVPGVDTTALAAKAWHSYGTVVGRNMTYAEALTTAGLDWTAAMAPLTAITARGVVEVDTHRATYRSDTGDVLWGGRRRLPAAPARRAPRDGPPHARRRLR